MPILFGDSQLDKEEGLVSTILFYSDTNTLNNAKLVSKSWLAAVKAMYVRDAIYSTILRRCQQFPSLRFEGFNIYPLSGGLTNNTYKITVNRSSFVARLPGMKSELSINRQAEGVNATMASQCGINAEMKYFDGNTGAQLTVFLKDPVQMTSDTLQSAQYLKSAMQALLTIHQCGKRFANDIDVFVRNEEMFAKLQAHPAETIAEYQQLMRKMRDIQTVFQSLHLPTVPCHNDTTPTNFVASEGKLYLIDWEYSGNNMRLWDLVCLAMESDFSSSSIETMLTCYYGQLDGDVLNQFRVLMPVYDLWCALWASVKLASDKAVENRETYIALEAMRRTHCMDMLSSSSFLQAFDALKASINRLNANTGQTAVAGKFSLFAPVMEVRDKACSTDKSELLPRLSS